MILLLEYLINKIDKNNELISLDNHGCENDRRCKFDDGISNKTVVVGVVPDVDVVVEFDDAVVVEETVVAPEPELGVVVVVDEFPLPSMANHTMTKRMPMINRMIPTMASTVTTLFF